MKKFSGLEDLRKSRYYPKSEAELHAARSELLSGYDRDVRELGQVPKAVLDAANVVFTFLMDAVRVHTFEHDALAVAGLRYFLTPHDALPDRIEGVGFSDDSIVLDAVVKEITGAKPSSARRAKLKPAGSRVRAAARKRSRPHRREARRPGRRRR